MIKALIRLLRALPKGAWAVWKARGAMAARGRYFAQREVERIARLRDPERFKFN